MFTRAMCLCVIRSVMEKSFLEYYDFYEGVCKERLYLQGQNMQVSCASLIFVLIDRCIGCQQTKVTSTPAR